MHKLSTLFDTKGIKMNNLFTFRWFNQAKVRNRAALPILVKLPEDQTRENILSAAKKLRNIDNYKLTYLHKSRPNRKRTVTGLIIKTRA